MFHVEYTKRFKRDVKRAEVRQKKISRLEKIMKAIEEGRALPAKMQDHALSGNWAHHRELHIESDWLLIYRYERQDTVIFVRTGSHSDLFK